MRIVVIVRTFSGVKKKNFFKKKFGGSFFPTISKKLSRIIGISE